MRKNMLLAIVALPVFAASGLAQTTGTPSFNAPYRAFTKHEFGGTISFPKNANIGLEGQYRFGYQKFDLGFRGGFIDLGNGAPTDVVIGAEGRSRVIEHTENFPFDGALIVGLGGSFIGGRTGDGH